MKFWINYNDWSNKSLYAIFFNISVSQIILQSIALIMFLSGNTILAFFYSYYIPNMKSQGNNMVFVNTKVLDVLWATWAFITQYTKYYWMLISFGARIECVTPVIQMQILLTDIHIFF